MGYLVRKADAFLREWKKNPDRKPLIIKGARQVGKTETIRTFARENYKNVIEINFITEPSYKVIVEEGFSAEHIIKLISRIDPTKHFEENETLIFFDEIQDFPEIATALKFFKENGKYDVICSGSLLGVQYQRIASISVGYKTDYQMYSMDFEEFLWAKGYSEEAISDMLCHMLEGVAFSEAEQMIFSNLFLEYCILGGMPAIVSSYIDYREYLFCFAASVSPQKIKTRMFDIIQFELRKRYNESFRIYDCIVEAEFEIAYEMKFIFPYLWKIYGDELKFKKFERRVITSYGYER